MDRSDKNGIENKIKTATDTDDSTHGAVSSHSFFRNAFATAHVRWTLVFIDFFIYILVSGLILVLYQNPLLTVSTVLYHGILFLFFCFGARFLLHIYNQIWRYGGIQSYMMLLAADSSAFLAYRILTMLLSFQQIIFVRALSLYSINLLAVLALRMTYRYAYKCGTESRFWSFFLRIFLGKDYVARKRKPGRIPVAIVGAGRVGTGLADEFISNEKSVYTPVLFIDTDREKIGRQIHDIHVTEEYNFSALEAKHVQEIIFAQPRLSTEKKKELYENYTSRGYRVKIYDYPLMESAGRKVIREIDIEELLFRKPVVLSNDNAKKFYRGKTILITGGGGSIGSEICRQLAKLEPKQLIVLDIYENGAYDVQQELKMAYKGNLDVRVEIVSVCNPAGLERTFRRYSPEIVIMAAAHKHVPLMETNSIEAVENNVFGTLNTVKKSVEHGVERVIMVSTDKAVNPTNVMGATKRLCEMIVQAYSASGCKTTFSATRFGNVLGSAGSVIPLFKKQIASGGPVTLTDKRIIRYFMTIPEASRLVLESGALAHNGELFVLDMGKPVKILDLAESMIRLSGLEPGVDIKIEEVGLRPGEKLYEELLISTEKLTQTENDLIFIEYDTPLTMAEIEKKLSLLQTAINTGEDEEIKKIMPLVVPTYSSGNRNGN